MYIVIYIYFPTLIRNDPRLSILISALNKNKKITLYLGQLVIITNNIMD